MPNAGGGGGGGARIIKAATSIYWVLTMFQVAAEHSVHACYIAKSASQHLQVGIIQVSTY